MVKFASTACETSYVAVKVAVLSLHFIYHTLLHWSSLLCIEFCNAKGKNGTLTGSLCCPFERLPRMQMIITKKKNKMHLAVVEYAITRLTQLIFHLCM